MSFFFLGVFFIVVYTTRFALEKFQIEDIFHLKKFSFLILGYIFFLLIPFVITFSCIETPILLISLFKYMVFLYFLLFFGIDE